MPYALGWGRIRVMFIGISSPGAFMLLAGIFGLLTGWSKAEPPAVAALWERRRQKHMP